MGKCWPFLKTWCCRQTTSGVATSAASSSWKTPSGSPGSQTWQWKVAYLYICVCVVPIKTEILQLQPYLISRGWTNQNRPPPTDIPQIGTCEVTTCRPSGDVSSMGNWPQAAWAWKTASSGQIPIQVTRLWRFACSKQFPSCSVTRAPNFHMLSPDCRV